MYCKRCGKKNPDHVNFCSGCGEKLKKPPAPVQPAAQPVPPAPAQAVQPVAQPMSAAVPVYEETPTAVVSDDAPAMPMDMLPATDWKNSKFDGGVGGMIGVNIVVGLLSVLSLGFAWPALWCYKLRWIYKHTIIGGYRMKFTGRGGQLFGRALLWGLLTVVTLTIYGLWVPIKYKRWEISHVEIDSMIPREQ